MSKCKQKNNALRLRAKQTNDIILTVKDNKLKITKRMRELLSYDKMAGPVPRLLLLEGKYWLDAACLNAAHHLGWEVKSVRVPMEGVLDQETIGELLLALSDFKPDAVLSINLSAMDFDGIFAQMFVDLQIPYISWFVDNPRTIMCGSKYEKSPFLVGLTWDEAYTESLESAGFGTVATLPLATDPHIFKAEVPDTWELPPTFVGNSMRVVVKGEWKWINERPALAEAVREALDTGKVTRENFRYGIDKMLDPALVEKLDIHEKRHAEILMFVEQTLRLRQEMLQLLEPDGLEVRGDEGWNELTKPAGGPVDYNTQLANVYRQAEINLNITSIQMPTAVNQRVLDCPAAGGFLLTDAQPALENMFDTHYEIASYTSPEECLDLFRFYRTNPKARRELTQRAQRRIINEHTYAHRLITIADLLKDTFAN